MAIYKNFFSEIDKTDKPKIYLWSQEKSNELMEYHLQIYSKISDWRRFFTVYGPHCRPDLESIILLKISRMKPIQKLLIMKLNHPLL